MRFSTSVRSWTRRRVFVVCMLAALIAGAPGVLGAQTADTPIPAPGFQPDHAYFGLFPFENIDTASGNLLLTFVDWGLPGYNGMDVVFQRTFNSASGWTFGLAGVPMRVLRPDGPPAGATGPDYFDPAGLPVLLTSDGGTHRTWWDGDSGTPRFVTQEFWRYVVQGRRLELPNGTECLYDSMGALIEVRDRFSNRLEVVNDVSGTETYPTLIRQRLGDGRIRELALTYTTAVTQSGTYRLLTASTFADGTWTYVYGGSQGLDLVRATPPLGPGWSFARTYRPDSVPSLTVTVPQGGQVVYTFLDVPSDNVRSGTLSTREALDGGNPTSQWTFDLQNDGSTPPVYRGVLNGPESVQLVYGHGAGPADGSDDVLLYRELWDAGANARVEREEYTYTATQVTDVSTDVRNLVSTMRLARDDRTYTTTLAYQPGNTSGRFADYGRPWKIQEVGDAGTRESIRTFNYNFSGYLVDRVASATTTIGAESSGISWTYNSATGFLESATRSGITTTYTVEPAIGAVRAITDAHQHTTNLAYDWGVVRSVATPLHTTTRAINADGSVASETRRGATTYYEYDALGRVIWTKPPLGYWIGTEYDLAAARWVKTTRNDGQNAGAETTTWLDGFGRPVNSANSLDVKTRVAYDALGRKSYESLRYTTADVGRTFRYDVLGRAREIQTADGKKVTYAYSNGTDVAITDQEHRVTRQDWAAFGSPGDARLIGITDADNHAWTYEYNVDGRLTKLVQPGGPTREWQYAGDLLTRSVQPESGQTTYTYVGGRLATTTTARGTVSVGYDSNDRVTSIDAPGTADDVTFEYDESDNRTVVQNGYSRSAFEFDLANHVTHRRDTLVGQPERDTVYTYDGWDNVASVTYPSGTVVSYTYDRENRVTAAWRGTNATLVAEVLEYHPSGAPTRIRFANGIQETYTYDPNRYWLRQIEGGPVQLTYERDGVGNVTSIADGRPQFNQAFTYDNVNRLRFVSGWAANEYQYDPLGNRTAKAAPAVTYTYDAATKRLTNVSGNSLIPEVGAYGYDGVGNLTSDPSGTYAYTPFNMLETATVGGTTATYRYDGTNKRRMRIMPDRTDYFYPGADNVGLSEYSRATADIEAHWIRDYIYLGGRVVASVARR